MAGNYMGNIFIMNMSIQIQYLALIESLAGALKFNMIASKLSKALFGHTLGYLI